eukprot:Opistho-1_new@49506
MTAAIVRRDPRQYIVPAIARRFLARCGTDHATQRCLLHQHAGGARIGGGLVRLDQPAGAAVRDQCRRARHIGGDDCKATRHRLQVHIAERLGHAGVDQDVGAGHRAAQCGALQMAGEDGIGHALLEPAARRTLADDERADHLARCAQGIDRVGEDAQPLFLHQPPEEERDDIVGRIAECRAGRLVAQRGIEGRRVDPAAPDRYATGAMLGRKLVRDRQSRREDQVAIAVEAIEIAFEHRPQKAHAVISGIGFEPRMQARHHRNPLRPRPFLGLAPQQVGRGEMDDVGRERLELRPRRPRQAQREPVFGPPGQRKRTDRADIACRIECGFRRARGEDTYLRP